MPDGRNFDIFLKLLAELAIFAGFVLVMTGVSDGVFLMANQHRYGGM